VKKKGMGGGNAKEQKSIAFLIGRKISKEGTKAQPYLRPALFNNKRNIQDLMGR
jgi:hypothetical protein